LAVGHRRFGQHIGSIFKVEGLQEDGNDKLLRIIGNQLPKYAV
jgi:hypothetical protein